jgi:hypothetical protein
MLSQGLLFRSFSGAAFLPQTAVARSPILRLAGDPSTPRDRRGEASAYGSGFPPASVPTRMYLASSARNAVGVRTPALRAFR